MSCNANDPSVELHEMASDIDKNEVFVYPWMGIVANILVEKKGGRDVGKSGSVIRDHLTSRGFTPVRVTPIWNRHGFSGYALIEFNNDWPGFCNAMAFEKSYEADCHGKRDYHKANPKGDQLYGWVARADDYYNSSDGIGTNLQRKGDLKTVADIEAEEERKTSKLVTNLTNEIEMKNKCLQEMECKYNETSAALSSLMNERDKMVKLYNVEIEKMQERAHGEVEKVIVGQQKIKLQLEAQRDKLIQREQELRKLEANNENDRRKLDLEKQMNAEATLEQQKTEKKLLKLAEEQKREKEEVHKKIIGLEKELNAKQVLGLEIQRLKGAELVMKHMGQDGDEQVKKQLLDIQRELKQKEEDLESIGETTQHLIVKERRSNEELQEARKELVTGLMDHDSRFSIGIKRMGELDFKIFQNALKRKSSRKEVEEEAVELCSLWQDYLRDAKWHPFKVVKVEGSKEMQEIIDKDDEKLKGLMDKYGNQVYQIVVTALKEMNEYNPSGRYPVSELWNFKQKRKASLKEAIEYTIGLWKQKKQRRT